MGNEPTEKSPPKRASGKKSTPPPSQNESSFNEQSILQHVRQTIRNLPGGLDIVGFFTIASSTNKKVTDNAVAVNKALRSAHKMCAKVSNMGVSNIDDSSSASDGRMLLLTLDSSPSNAKKPSITIVDCRPDVQSTAPSTTVPFSYQNLRWRSLSTRLFFDVPLFVATGHSKDNFLKQFVDAVRPWCRRLWTAKATVNGILRDDGEPLQSTTSGKAGAKGKKAAAEEVESDTVDFFFIDDFKSVDTHSENPKLENGAVSMRVRGTMYCLAYVNQKATVGEGVQALKTDALRSLYSRCELHYDGMTVLEGEELDPVAVHQFPRRVFAPLSNSNLLVTDYLFEGDVSGDAAASFKDLLDIDLTPDAIVDKWERVPNENTLEKLLRSSSISTTPEGSIDGLDRPISQEFDISGQKSMTRNTIVYFVLAVIMALVAYLCYFLFGK